MKLCAIPVRSTALAAAVVDAVSSSLAPQAGTALAPVAADAHADAGVAVAGAVARANGCKLGDMQT